MNEHKPSHKHPRGTRQINIDVKNSDYEIIANKAKLAGMPMASYIRFVLLNTEIQAPKLNEIPPK